MPRPTPSAAELEVEVALLEAEVLLLAELQLDGRVVPGRRAPSTPELRAGVRFATLEELVEQAAGDLIRIGAGVREEVLDRLAADLGQLAGDPNPATVARRLTALADPTRDEVLAGLRDEVLAPARQQAYTRLADLHQAAGAEAIAEAARQGAPVTGRLPAPTGKVTAQLLTDRAEEVAGTHYRRILDAAHQAAITAPPTAGTFDVIEAAIDAGEQASTKAGEDAARRAAGVAHDEGRTATLTELAETNAPAAADGLVDPTGPLQPREIYASELLDRNTCGPCSMVDGRDYDSLEEALADYPGNGGFHACQGRDRCRGTLVIVWDTEAAPTIDDRRGEGPDAPPRQPVPEPPPPPAPPRTPAQLSDDELMAGITEALLAGDDALADELGAELDRRDAQARPEPPPAPHETAPDSWGWDEEDEARQVAEEYAGDAQAYARDMARAAEEFEAAGGGAIAAGIRAGVGGNRPRGRRIDAVRDEWAIELERRYVELEDATRGALFRRDREAEFDAKYGPGRSIDVLMAGPARTAYYYASEEVRTVWAARPRITFDEFAVQRGIRDAKTLDRARRAGMARDDAAARAEEGARTAGSKARASAKRRRQAMPATEGDKLRKAQARAARERAREAKIAERTGREDLPTPPPPPPPATWRPLTPAELTPDVVTSRVRRKTAAKITHAVRRDNVTVIVEPKLTTAQLDTLLEDLDAVLKAAGPNAPPFTLHIPTGDSQFRTRRNGGFVGGYVVRGGNRLFLNPKVANGELDVVANARAGQFMPAAEAVNRRRYTIAHELGHIVDGSHHHSYGPPTPSRVPGAAPGVTRPGTLNREAAMLHARNTLGFGTYGRTNLAEGYAEAFAQWVLGGPGSSPLADEYAKVFGWR